MRLELFYPIKPFTITQHFGENLSPIYKQWGLLGHPGIDMVGTYGQVVRAAHDGIVTYVGYDSNEGQGIVIRTKYTRDYKDGTSYFKTIYWHLLDGSAKVKVEDEVKCGDVIAQCDSTGVLQGVKFGPVEKSHLHFGLKPIAQGEADWVWDNREQSNGYNGNIDPEPYFNGMYSEDYKDTLSVVTNTQAVINAVKANPPQFDLTFFWKKVDDFLKWFLNLK